MTPRTQQKCWMRRALSAMPVCAVVVMMAGCGTTGSPSEAVAPAARHVHAARGIAEAATRQTERTTPRLEFWGAQFPYDRAGDDETAAASLVDALRQFGRQVGASPSLVPVNIPFITCGTGTCQWLWLPHHQLAAIRQRGAVPMINWSSMASPLHTVEPAYALKRVTDGAYDSYITEFAKTLRSDGGPIFLRFDWEMNAPWFPWGAGANGNTPADFVAAWRHVHNIFDRVGARNVVWVWCPYASPHASADRLRRFYPGNAYVNWTCLDGYNYGLDGDDPRAWRSFDSVFRPSYLAIAKQLAPTKPMMIGEVATNDAGGNKAQWIDGMFASLRHRYFHVRALLWYDQADGGQDWQLTSSRGAVAAFANGIRQTAEHVASGLSASGLLASLLRPFVRSAARGGV